MWRLLPMCILYLKTLNDSKTTKMTVYNSVTIIHFYCFDFINWVQNHTRVCVCMSYFIIVYYSKPKRNPLTCMCFMRTSWSWLQWKTFLFFLNKIYIYSLKWCPKIKLDDEWQTEISLYVFYTANLRTLFLDLNLDLFDVRNFFIQCNLNI